MDNPSLDSLGTTLLDFLYERFERALMAVINGVAAGLSYVASPGDLTVAIVCTAISIGITQGISYYKD